MPQNDPNLGRRIKHFQISRTLGEGGIGQVYLAEDLNSKTQVALKLLKPEVSRNSELRTRFLQEAQIAKEIAHENIVKIIDFGETNAGECFLVMEHLNGKTLTQVLDALDGPMPLGQVAHIGIQICAALQAAHARNAVHRDLKPDNIYITNEGNQRDIVKVLDFGLAKHTETSQEHALTTVGKVLGTPYFMSPEQTVGDPVDGRTDIYSLGVVLYQIATNTLPFTGKTLGEVMYKQVHQPAPAPKSRNAKIDAKLSAVILACLQKDRAQRPPSMIEVAKALAAAAGVKHEPYFSQGSKPPELTSSPSWSIGVPIPEEVRNFRSGVKPTSGSVASLPSESQIETVHLRPAKKSPKWLAPVAALIFIATIALLLATTR